MSVIKYLLDEHVDMTFGETLDELILIWGASETEEYADRLNYLPVSS